MAAIVMSLVTTFVITALLWLGLGSRLKLSTDEALNDRKNLAAYFFGIFPVVFVAVFFLLERL